MEADLAAARRAGGPPMRLRKSPTQFPRAPGKRTNGQMARRTTPSSSLAIVNTVQFSTHS